MLTLLLKYTRERRYIEKDVTNQNTKQFPTLVTKIQNFRNANGFVACPSIKTSFNCDPPAQAWTGRAV